MKLHRPESNLEARRQGAWLIVRRPIRYWDVVFDHLPLAAVSGITLGLAAFTPAHWSFHRACTFLDLTGYPCLFCGGTRAFRAMTQGEWQQAFTNSPFAAALFVFAAVVFLWNLIGLLSGHQLRFGPRLRFWSGRGKTVMVVLMVLLFANWIYRMIRGLS